MSQYKRTSFQPGPKTPSDTEIVPSEYRRDAEKLRVMFPSWTASDLASVLAEVRGDVGTAVTRITEGHAEQWGTAARKKDKKTHGKDQHSISGSPSSAGYVGGYVAVHGGARGVFGGRGSLRGGRGGAHAGCWDDPWGPTPPAPEPAAVPASTAPNNDIVASPNPPAAPPVQQQYGAAKPARKPAGPAGKPAGPAKMTWAQIARAPEKPVRAPGPTEPSTKPVAAAPVPEPSQLTSWMEPPLVPEQPNTVLALTRNESTPASPVKHVFTVPPAPVTSLNGRTDNPLIASDMISEHSVTTNSPSTAVSSPTMLNPAPPSPSPPEPGLSLDSASPPTRPHSTNDDSVVVMHVNSIDGSLTDNGLMRLGEMSPSAEGIPSSPVPLRVSVRQESPAAIALDTLVSTTVSPLSAPVHEIAAPPLQRMPTRHMALQPTILPDTSHPPPFRPLQQDSLQTLREQPLSQQVEQLQRQVEQLQQALHVQHLQMQVQQLQQQYQQQYVPQPGSLLNGVPRQPQQQIYTPELRAQSVLGVNRLNQLPPGLAYHHQQQQQQVNNSAHYLHASHQHVPQQQQYRQLSHSQAYPQQSMPLPPGAYGSEIGVLGPVDRTFGGVYDIGVGVSGTGGMVPGFSGPTTVNRDLRNNFDASGQHQQHPYAERYYNPYGPPHLGSTIIPGPFVGQETHTYLGGHAGGASIGASVGGMGMGGVGYLPTPPTNHHSVRYEIPSRGIGPYDVSTPVGADSRTAVEFDRTVLAQSVNPDMISDSLRSGAHDPGHLHSLPSDRR